MRRWRLRLDLDDLVDRLEAAAHEVVPAAARYVSNGDPEDMERRYCVEQLALLQADLQKLRPVIDQLGSTLI
jgi:hypothetical protein